MIPNITRLIEHNRSGKAVGLPCFCTANELVMRAIFKYAREHETPVVIEATCNQVNQDGGYTGMTALDFSNWINSLAAEHQVPQDAVLLGGDHLGPNPWRRLHADTAMEKASVLVKAYAEAGFRKIHLDASMACGDEPTPSFELVAERAARLCKIAEDHSPNPDDLIYIIGTEVPVPGGESDDMDSLSITTADRLKETIETHQQAFHHAGLDNAWEKIVSVVTQPGVDFSHTHVHCFEPEKASALSGAILKYPELTFEAHSTDYQPTRALQELVENHFLFLKVGPELTFRMREAVFSLAAMEKHLLSDGKRSNLVETVHRAMAANTDHWAPYYQGSDQLIEQLKVFSFSDRIRYYWSEPKVHEALQTLLTNLAEVNIPESIISQYFSAREFGSIAADAQTLAEDHIALCIRRYYQACGYH
jgi:D-tagatose-1,6-bisphosphate aldolase subunit GatZ/KbaZ